MNGQCASPTRCSSLLSPAPGFVSISINKPLLFRVGRGRRDSCRVLPPPGILSAGVAPTPADRAKNNMPINMTTPLHADSERGTSPNPPPHRRQIQEWPERDSPPPVFCHRVKLMLSARGRRRGHLGYLIFRSPSPWSEAAAAECLRC